MASAHWLHPWLETHLRRNVGLSNPWLWERTWTQLSATPCMNGFTSKLVCKAGRCACFIRLCRASASCLPGEAWCRCPLRRPGCLLLVYWLRMHQGAFSCPAEMCTPLLTTHRGSLQNSKSLWRCFLSFFCFSLQYRIWVTNISALNLALN